LLNKIQLLTQP